MNTLFYVSVFYFSSLVVIGQVVNGKLSSEAKSSDFEEKKEELKCILFEL